jgi:GMP synthase-like glutamine amidotransferase
VDVLAVIHEEAARAGVFGDEVAARGHRLEEWSFAWERPPHRPLETYGAVLVLGGSMHADQDDQHPWLREEDAFLRRLLELRLPVLGVCLGVQLIAKAAGARVYSLREPEIGWAPVEVTDAGAEDPVLGRLPRRFDAFHWHYYTYELPDAAVELARSPACTQALRLGESTWGIQFHAEVTLPQIELWTEQDDDEPVPQGLLLESHRKIGESNELGRRLCGAFLEYAQQASYVRLDVSTAH